MAEMLASNAVLRGRLSIYTIVKELHKAVDEGAVYLARWVPVIHSSYGRASSVNPFYRTQKQEQ